MPLALLLAIQAAVAAEPDRGAPVFDLGKVGSARGFELKSRPIAGCDDDDATEIVVCGSRSQSDPYRVRPLDPTYDNRPIIAETGLFGDVTAGMHVEGAQLANGMISKRLLIRLTKPF